MSADIHPRAVATTTTSPKAAILDAAQRLIMRNGYAGLSMRELSLSSGLAKGTIYYYFRDKRAIYLSVLERDMLAMAACIAEAAQVEGDCVQRLRSVVETYFDLVRANGSLIIARLREISGMEESVRQLVNKHRPALLQPVIAILQEGMATGLFRPLDAEMAVASLFSMMNGFATHRLLLEQSEITDDVIEHTLTLFVRGIAADGRHADPGRPLV